MNAQEALTAASETNPRGVVVMATSGDQTQMWIAGQVSPVELAYMNVMFDAKVKSDLLRNLTRNVPNLEEKRNDA